MANPADVTNMWMQTYTGRQFYPFRPQPMEVHPLDIGHALAMTCRYGGHVDQFYSVAEHCVLLHDYFLAQGKPRTALHALLHDAAEAYVGDLIRPIKRFLPDFAGVEEDVLTSIYVALRVHPPVPGSLTVQVIREADLRITLNERDALISKAVKPWVHEDLGPLPGVQVMGWGWRAARDDYMQRLDDRLREYSNG